MAPPANLRLDSRSIAIQIPGYFRARANAILNLATLTRATHGAHKRRRLRALTSRAGKLNDSINQYAKAHAIPSKPNSYDFYELVTDMKTSLNRVEDILAFGYQVGARASPEPALPSDDSDLAETDEEPDPDDAPGYNPDDYDDDDEPTG
ncbi:MAG: hypothetical protein M1836_001820 [Candelina mexicana]|nr:MAG: hypothetical protein M1836_001820 [Candelina mexicana]